MSINDIFRSELYREYELMHYASGNKSKPSLVKIFLHVVRRPTGKLHINSKKLTKIIRQYDSIVYKDIDDVHFGGAIKGVKEVNYNQINFPNDQAINYIEKYVLRYYENNEKPLKYENWDSALSKSAKDMIDSEAIQDIRTKYDLVVQNAYYIYDYFSKKEYHHFWHQDDVGFRTKFWFVLDSNGSVGVNWAPINLKELKKREFGENRFVFCDEPSDSKFQPSLPKSAYIINTDCYHKGSLGKDSSRLAFVVELINKEKMTKIDGIASACHHNPDMLNY